MKLRTLMLALAGGCALSALAGAAFADPPGLVGRISDVEGDVSFLPSGEDAWTYATRNYPVAPGESFWTGDSGRTELQIGPVEVRLDSETELDVLALDYGQTRFGLPQGSMDLRVWQVPRGGISIATPAGDVRIDREGVYRIDVGASQDEGYPPVEVTVFDGEAAAPGAEGFTLVDSGASALIYAGEEPDIEDAQDASIDDWARMREGQEHWDRQAAFSPSLTGYEDLEGQGDFVDTPDYGTVWFPYDVPADWAPYRYGHWASVQPWGWTWIDDQPWGFAPFHYGRWAQINGRWAWVPGRAGREPVYAPALVAFVGGRGWSIGFGAGGAGEAVGWIPLAPDEAYRPSYPVSQDYERHINAGHVRELPGAGAAINAIVDVTQYRNARAATVVRSAAFAGGAPIQRAAAPVPLAVLAHAPVTTASTAPAPTPQARSGAAIRPGAGVAHGAPSGAAPPPRLQAVRAAVAAQPAGSTKPPTIAGAKITPHVKPAPGAPAFVAPAQVKNPAVQGRGPVKPPVYAPSGGAYAPRAPQGAAPLAHGAVNPPPRATVAPPPAPPAPQGALQARPGAVNPPPPATVRPPAKAHGGDNKSGPPASESSQPPAR